MSTRSYVGIIDNGRVWYGYHHSDSYLESLGVELFKQIKTSAEAWDKIKEFTEIKHEDTVDSYFETPEIDVFIEFCYGFDVYDGNWYVSSSHFHDGSKTHKLIDVVADDDKMQRYAEMYCEDAQSRIISQIREEILGNKTADTAK